MRRRLFLVLLILSLLLYTAMCVQWAGSDRDVEVWLFQHNKLLGGVIRYGTSAGFIWIHDEADPNLGFDYGHVQFARVYADSARASDFSNASVNIEKFGSDSFWTSKPVVLWSRNGSWSSCFRCRRYYGCEPPNSGRQVPAHRAAMTCAGMRCRVG